MSRLFNEDEFAHKLLVRIQKGDSVALNTLYIYFRSPLYTRARKAGLTREDAEDVVSETFKRILEGIDTYKEKKQGGWRWIKAIFYHSLTDKLRNFAQEIKRFDKNLRYEELTEISSKEPDHPQLAEQIEEVCALTCAWINISHEDQLIIIFRGERGPAGRKWKEAMARYYNEFQKCLHGY